MSTPLAARDYQADLERFAKYSQRELRRLWYQVGEEFDEDWYPLIPAAAEQVAIAQKAAVVVSAAYTPRMLAQSGQDAPPVGDIDTQGYVGTNRYGNPIPQVLAGATTKAKNLVKEGYAVGAALFEAGQWLESTGRTLVFDAGRSVVSADIMQRPQLSGYVRVLNPPSCARCIPLAGKWFRWNEGFQRHPTCDCVHCAAKSEGYAKAEGFITDPYEYFNSLSKSQQDRLFGENDAEALRNGGDIYRVTNIRRRGLADGSRRRSQARKYGTPSRMTVDDIMRASRGNRERAVQMLLDEGYITGPQQVGGNIKGRYYTGIGGTMGRGGTRRGATMAYQRALATGVRDPYSPAGVSLDPATQTAAERALHTAYLRKRAIDEGRNPFGSHRLTNAERRLVLNDYDVQLRALKSQPRQVRRLAALLGMV